MMILIPELLSQGTEAANLLSTQPGIWRAVVLTPKACTVHRMLPGYKQHGVLLTQLRKLFKHEMLLMKLSLQLW